MKYYRNKGFIRNFIIYSRFLLAHKSKFLWSLVFSIIRLIPNYSFPIFIKIIVDSYIPSHDMKSIYFMIGVVAVMGMLFVFYQVGFAVLRTDVAQNISRDLRNIIINKLQLLSLSYHDQAEAGRYYSKIMVDVERIQRFSDILFNIGINLFFGLTYTIIILLFINSKILLYSLVLILFYALLYRAFKKRLTALQYKGRMAREDLSQEVNIFIQTNTLARIHGEEEYHKEQIDNKSRQVVSKYKKLISSIAFFNSSNFSTSRLFQISLIALTAAAVIRKELLIGEMFLFIQYFSIIMELLSQIINQFPEILEFSEAVNSIDEILNAPDIEYNEGKKQLQNLRGRIDFKNVVFSYPGKKKKAIENLTLSIRQGETIALVGSSGSGKTTFINLLMGLYRSYSGEISIDGISLDRIDMRSVRKRIGVVTQEPIIFSGTIADNIGHAREFSGKDLIEAAKRAYAHDFIMEMPEKYDSIIGERGVMLSGGERQRIAIARAILRKPSILIFDEATSSLDSESEKKVQKAIENIFGSQTTIVIAHRLSTIFHADRILVFKKGRIIESGTHKELAGLNGEYAKLLAIQFNRSSGEIKKISKGHLEKQ